MHVLVCTKQGRKSLYFGVYAYFQNKNPDLDKPVFSKQKLFFSLITFARTKGFRKSAEKIKNGNHQFIFHIQNDENHVVLVNSDSFTIRLQQSIL